MPALIGLSPRLADHTFPRDDHELRLVAQALGRLSGLLENQTVQILRTGFFEMLLNDFRWDAAGGIKNQIYMHLNLWFLQGRSSLAVQADTGGRPYSPHPIPENCRTQNQLEDLWADELGKVVVLHDDNIQRPDYFIGIACEKAFAGQAIGTYEPHTCTRFFPLVGPEHCDCRHEASALSDAYMYQVPPSYTQTEVSFATAKKNVHVIGGEVRNPTRGSHYTVKFPGERSWRLDPNDDPVPETYLKQLVQLTGLPFETIVYALREGHMPPLCFRLGGC